MTDILSEERIAEIEREFWNAPTQGVHSVVLSLHARELVLSCKALATKLKEATERADKLLVLLQRSRVYVREDSLNNNDPSTRYYSDSFLCELDAAIKAADAPAAPPSEADQSAEAKLTALREGISRIRTDMATHFWGTDAIRVTCLEIDSLLEKSNHMSAAQPSEAERLRKVLGEISRAVVPQKYDCRTVQLEDVR